MNVLSKSLAVLLCLVVVPVLYAQEPGQQIRLHARPGHPTITLYVMGNATYTGIWRVEQGISFIELLTVLNAARSETQQVETETRVTLDLYRKVGNERALVYHAKLEEAIAANVVPPGLQNEDVLVVSSVTKRKFSIRSLTTILGAASSLVLLALRISRL